MLICTKSWYLEHSLWPIIEVGTKYYKYIDYGNSWAIVDDLPDRLRGLNFPKEYFTEMSEQMYRILYE